MADTSRDNARRIFWFNDLKTPNVHDALSKIDTVVAHKLFFDAPEDENWAIMETCHAYCITAARDEVPDHYKGHGELLDRCQNILVLSSSGAGYDPIDVDACTERGVLVVNQSGANAEAVAEHAVGMMMNLTKQMLQTDRSMRTERGVSREVFKGWNMEGKTVGVVGLGNTGRRVARICKHGLSMRVLAYDPYISDADFEERGATKVALEELLAQSDYVSINCPFNEETKDLIDRAELALMQPSAFLVNCARGGIANEEAMTEALADEQIRGIGLDVWDLEPPPLDHPLLKFDNIIATYHTAGVTVESRENMANWNADQVVETLNGKRPERLINPEAWDKFCDRYEAMFGERPEG
ncbi:MAG: 3-phosphoglycerate dehydrogenase [Rhodospirillaceae bacterium]|nr:3-phosphoglycerate dehydrogenase [Rhodospirillaceae bacterium]HAA92385.1 3-phosphoglycerate dehydrogenase [Rhodospirillaceae bacterium]